MKTLPTDYQNYIALSRYSRFLPDKKRRETWEETVGRYVDFWSEKSNQFPKELVFNAISKLEVMPSMRALMTAGKALDRDNAAGYNCAAVAIDDPRAFDEILYLGMCGCGVGFSVERQVISKLPAVAEEFFETDTVIKVKDSKIGWAAALRELISLLYSGQIPKWDLSALRPAGAPLKTFGGRSSGPDPFDDLLKKTVSIFKNASGRKLTSLECHDIVMHISAATVVGGVRRAACISMSNLSDERMRSAKSGQWWVDNPQRALANNSVAYTEKPDIGVFMKEWQSLYESKSGERGIFNRQGAVEKMKRLGRRDWKKYEEMHGMTNPCCFTAETLVAVADGRNAVSIGQLAAESNGIITFPVYSARPKKQGKGWKTEIKTAIASKTGEKKVVKVTLSNGDTFTCTDDHLLALPDGSYIMTRDSLGKNLVAFDQNDNGSRDTSSVRPISIEDVGVRPIFDLQVEDNHNFYIVTNSLETRGILVHNSEIFLRSAGFCNLSEVIIREDDTLETLLKKIEIAAIIGTFQSSLTNFRYLRSIWKKNAEEERLLGVSLTGIMDHPVLANVSEEAKSWLTAMKNRAIEVNKLWADKLDINQATAVSCVKPSGTVSALVDSSSGIHPRMSRYYIRRVRSDKFDPIGKFLRDQGVWAEDDIMNPEKTLVFSFPMKSPSHSKLASEMTAIDQLEHYLMFYENWAEHTVSITVYVREHEWLDVGAWVYKHFDRIGGISFLPYSEHTYKQAPFEPVSEEQYKTVLFDHPTIDWTKFNVDEHDDTTVGAQERACGGGNCEVF
jgi:hypothetical protein